MPINHIDIATLKTWMDLNEAVIIDVREPAEHEEMSIPSSVLIPLATVCKDRLPATHHKKMVMHCRSGKRSQLACEKLLAEDPSLELFNLEGGILAWGAI